LRRKRPKIDTRLDWRDPNLPVFGKSGKAYPPEVMQQHAQRQIRFSSEPSWRNDPTYNLRKTKPNE
jgi:hypothetical protein